MIRKLSKSFISFICEDKYSNTEKEEMNYILITIIFELIKAIFLLILFNFIGYFKETLFIILMLFSIKPFIGGYHENNQFLCFFASLLEIGTILFLSSSNFISYYSNVILILISIFTIYHKAPIINPKMIITREEIIKKNRFIGISASIIYGSISIFTYNGNIYSKIITWTLLMLSQLMFNKRNMK